MEDVQIMIEEVNGYWNTGELEYPFGRGINLEMKVSNIEKIRDNLEKYCLMNNEDISFVIQELKKSNYEYYNECESSSNIYIKVDDCDEFFYLLYKLYDLYLEEKEKLQL